MKKMVSSIGICVLCFSMILMSTQQAESTSPPPVGYWKFDEGSGSVAYDASGNENTGTLTDGPAWVDGKHGKALSFDGVDDYVNIPDSPSLRVQSFTLEAWIYMTQRPYEYIGGSHHHGAIINKLNFLGGTGTKGYKLQFEHPTSTNDHLVVSLGDGVAQRFLINYNSINDLTLNSWHYVAGTYNGTVANLYIDGELKASVDSNHWEIAHDSTPLAVGTEVPHLERCPFGGIIDGVKIYSYARTSEEIWNDYISSAPAIVLMPPSGFAATTVVGSGFSDNSRVTITWDETAIPTVPSPLFTDADGNFATIISVPTQNTPGTHTVNATDQIGNWATAAFTVVDMTGPQGPQGEEGPQGNKGDKGDTGEQGPPGVTSGELQFLLNGLTIAASIVAIGLATFALFRKRP